MVTRVAPPPTVLLWRRLRGRPWWAAKLRPPVLPTGSGCRNGTNWAPLRRSSSRAPRSDAAPAPSPTPQTLDRCAAASVACPLWAHRRPHSRGLSIHQSTYIQKFQLSNSWQQSACYSWCELLLVIYSLHGGGGYKSCLLQPCFFYTNNFRT